MVHNLVHNLCESLVTNIGDIADTGKRTPPTPITYLTQWKIVGNSEVHGQEIWSCGDYSEVDNKWHIRILPEGYGVVDIALDEPLRKVNDVVDTIEFPSTTEGKAVVTRNLTFKKFSDASIWRMQTNSDGKYRWRLFTDGLKQDNLNILCPEYDTLKGSVITNCNKGICCNGIGNIIVFDPDYSGENDSTAFLAANANTVCVYQINTPTTELVDAPQIAEADSYSMVISQGGKAIEWSSFETN